MTEIFVRAEPNQDSQTFILYLEDVKCDDINEWHHLSDQEQRQRIQTALDDMPEKPYWAYDSHYIK